MCLSNVDMEQLRNIMGCRDISGIQLKPEVKVAGLLGQRSLEKMVGTSCMGTYIVPLLPN